MKIGNCILVLSLMFAAPLKGGPIGSGSHRANNNPADFSSISREENHPSLLDISDEELIRKVRTDPSSLGSLSLGKVTQGVLLNADQMPERPEWDVVNPKESWGTTETIQAIIQAVEKVHQAFPGSPPLYIGDISYRTGGPINRHETHQAGRDVDVGFYYKGGKGIWQSIGTSRNLDLPRNWILLRAFVVFADVDVILLDYRIQRLLYRYALSIGEDKEWLNAIFQYPGGRKNTVVQHMRNHRTHYHVRLYNRIAQEMARRAYPYLLDMGLIKPPFYTVKHLVREGETLGQIAMHYRTSIRSIQRANRIRGTLIRAGRTYVIPCRGGAAPAAVPAEIPERCLPPFTPPALKSARWIP